MWPTLILRVAIIPAGPGAACCCAVESQTGLVLYSSVAVAIGPVIVIEKRLAQIQDRLD